ncbi:Insulin-like growth factor binding protein, N-terminal [Pseudocohnilembus persalinus]|uniref:Insulin-like growth factor binding protein, N-terminal n=1 Tax=Pseudocohnilembus persalinus TaxID=266149 RepID=A0A0V0R079_PSEPJ|nr:Insulin-like growth factor binding protein, N-terminal [Pseudocohnilembus persalinus]|eukprot:KRX07851.1 Insulin-like growth factor binding protein, N-terminal [Pseudocohnilembus persalinus]
MLYLLNFFFILTCLHIYKSQIQLTQNAINNWYENNITDIAQYGNLSQFIIHDNPKLHDYVQIGPEMFAVIYGLSNQDISVLQFFNNQGQTVSTKEFITIKNARDNIQITQTQVENEVFYAVLSSQRVYYGFSNHLSQTTRNCSYEQISMYAYQVQVKTAFDKIYLIIQGGDDDLFLHYIDISDMSTYQIYYTEHLEGNGPGFNYYKFSFQVYSDNSGIIIGNSWARETEVYQYSIETTGDVIQTNNKFNNSFLDSIFNQYTQFNFKKNVNSDQHTIVLGHESSDILKIYTGKMISNELQQLCLSEYTNISDISFKYLQFGILDTEYLWIKGEYKADKKTVILFANPSTYPCVFPCATCQSDNVTCATCVDNESLRQLPDCGCPNGYFNEFYINECQECSQFCETCIDYNTCTLCSSAENSVGTPSCQCLNGMQKKLQNMQ